MPFKVIDVDTDDEVLIFDIRNDSNGYPQFLIYINGEWKYRSAKYYIPIEEYYKKKYRKVV